MQRAAGLVKLPAGYRPREHKMTPSLEPSAGEKGGQALIAYGVDARRRMAVVPTPRTPVPVAGEHPP